MWTRCYRIPVPASKETREAYLFLLFISLVVKFLETGWTWGNLRVTSDTPALDVVRQLGCTPVFPVAQKLNRGVHVEDAILLLLYTTDCGRQHVCSCIGLFWLR